MAILKASKRSKAAPFQWKPLSVKQIKVLTWWMPQSPHRNKDAIICDGSVRAGKTVAMAFSFVAWATETFNGQKLGMCGKTIGSFRRNVLAPLKQMLLSRGYTFHERRSDNEIDITRQGVTNTYHIFGGKDEKSQDIVQGITLAGVFFDEVALMPKSFVDQAIARCSVNGRKFWFNCNPAGPKHWFKVEWLDDKVKRRVLHIHFTMDDNLSLSDEIREGYKRYFSGVFYKRFILGLWVMAEGAIYDMFDEKKHVVPTVPRKYMQYYVSCDHGTQNATTFGLWGLSSGVWYKIKEYHYSGKEKNAQKDNEAYYSDLVDFIGECPVRAVIVDPAAASFIATIEKYGLFGVLRAKNDVLLGIQAVATCLTTGAIAYNDVCVETIREYSAYTWDPKAVDRGEERPIKVDDHQMDADRYFVFTIVHKAASPLTALANKIGLVV